MVKVVGQDSTVSVEGYAGKALIDPAIVLVGKDGKDGKDGIPGPEGMPGRDGIDGVDGKDGKDGRDGVDGKDGISYWIEYDKKTNTLVFKNNGGKKSPAPVKLEPLAKGWGYGAGRGGGQVQADWNQTDKTNPTYIKNKPAVHNIRFLVVEELPTVGDPWTIYMVPEGENQRGGSGGNIYSEWVFVENETTHTLSWEKFGTEVDLSGYVPTSRKINDKELSEDITLSYSDVGAASAAQGAKADTAVQPATLNNYVTTNTLQTLSSGKKIFANDAVIAGNQTALLATISNSSTYTTDNAWVGRFICGAKNLTFLMGTYRTMAGIGAHSWSNAQTGSGAGWADFYLNPDGDKTVFIGGNLWTKNSGWLKIKNSGNTNGTVQVNRGSISSPSWKDVAYKGENISDFVNNSGYITSAVDDSSTTSTTKGWSASKLNSVIGDIESTLNAIRGV